MKAALKNIATSLLFVPVMALTFAAVAPQVSVYAEETTDCGVTTLTIDQGVNCAKGKDQPSDLFSADGVFKTITNVLLFLVGAISVIMLIIGGIRYTVSGGDTTAVTSAKNTILYAVVGILVSILAFAVVNFVVGSFAAPAA